MYMHCNYINCIIIHLTLKGIKRHYEIWMYNFLQNVYYLVHMVFHWQKETKEEIWLISLTKTVAPTENSKKQSDNTKTPPKTSISQWLRTDLVRSAEEAIAINWCG